MSNIIHDTILKMAPFDRKKTPSGWTSFNGSCCIHNRQSRPDTQKRAGVRLNTDGLCIYHCFNCSFTTSWEPGKALSKKTKSLLTWMGVQQEELKKIAFKIWQMQERIKRDLPVITWVNLTFNEAPLPIGAKSLSHWLEKPKQSQSFLKVLEYLTGRGDELVSSGEYYWSPESESDLYRRLIIPFYWKGKLVGWTARAIFPTKYRYFSEVQPNYLFNTEVLDNNWEYLILVEGPFDAKAIHGIATLGDHITTEQIQWLKQTGKRIIVVPDREKGGGSLVDAAVREGWYVSFPKWDKDVKDAAEAVKRYGRLYAMWTIIDAKTENRLQINVERQRLK